MVALGSPWQSAIAGSRRGGRLRQEALFAIAGFDGEALFYH